MQAVKEEGGDRGWVPVRSSPEIEIFVLILTYDLLHVFVPLNSTF